MSQSLAQVLLHIVFSTKEHHPFIDDAIETQLYAYMGGTIKQANGLPLKINGTADHVHILASMPRTISLADFIEDIKRNSSRWIKTKGSQYEKFAWQNGYGAFSVSFSQKGAVIEYIISQKEHHRKLTFKEELIAFLQKHEIAYNERYLWE